MESLKNKNGIKEEKNPGRLSVMQSKKISKIGSNSNAQKKNTTSRIK